MDSTDCDNSGSSVISDHSSSMIDGVVDFAAFGLADAYALPGRGDNDDYHLSWDSMGREEVPFYHAVRCFANVKISFDERCSVEQETYYGWFSSFEFTTCHWEQRVKSKYRLSDIKRWQLIQGASLHFVIL